jgi:hypothetical protein
VFAKDAEPVGRGTEFENLVGCLLELLRLQHPQAVTVKRHPHIDLQNGTFTVPDFELICNFQYQIDHRLIECQDRERSSQDIAHKIRTVKALSSHNRFILVFKDHDYLSAAVRQALSADGVAYYFLFEFAVFLERLSQALMGVATPAIDADGELRAKPNALHVKSIAAKPVQAPDLAGEMARVFRESLGASATTEFNKSRSDFSPKADQAMLSSPPRR